MPTLAVPQDGPHQYDSIVVIRPSAVFEMLTSLTATLFARKMEAFRTDVDIALGEEFLPETRKLYQVVAHPLPFAEIAVEYPNRDDVNGFVDYVEAMPIREFAFQALSRVFHRDQIPVRPDEKSVRALFESHPQGNDIMRVYSSLEWVNDLEGMRGRLCTTWRSFWRGFFKDRIDEILDELERSAEEKRRMLERDGAIDLINKITGWTSWHPRETHLRNPGIDKFELTKIELIPVLYSIGRAFGFAGYGTSQILYDALWTREHERQADDHKQRAIAVLKALADENRLNILKIIARNERRINGSTIARILQLSQSVVSRHITQLKNADLIMEHTIDNRNLTYSLRLERMREIGLEVESFVTE